MEESSDNKLIAEVSLLPEYVFGDFMEMLKKGNAPIDLDDEFELDIFDHMPCVRVMRLQKKIDDLWDLREFGDAVEMAVTAAAALYGRVAYSDLHELVKRYAVKDDSVSEKMIQEIAQQRWCVDSFYDYDDDCIFHSSISGREDCGELLERIASAHEKHPRHLPEDSKNFMHYAYPDAWLKSAPVKRFFKLLADTS